MAHFVMIYSVNGPIFYNVDHIASFWYDKFEDATHICTDEAADSISIFDGDWTQDILMATGQQSLYTKAQKETDNNAGA